MPCVWNTRQRPHDWRLRRGPSLPLKAACCEKKEGEEEEKKETPVLHLGFHLQPVGDIFSAAFVALVLCRMDLALFFLQSVLHSIIDQVLWSLRRLVSHVLCSPSSLFITHVLLFMFALKTLRLYT